MTVDWGPANMFAERGHAHLRLAAALDPQPRRKARKGGGRGLAHPDRARHAKALRDQAAAVVERHSRRTAVFGIDPDLVLVLEFNRPAAAMQDALGRSGLQLLGANGRHVVAAFSSDPELTAFLTRMAQYAQGVPLGKKVARYEDLFDSIEQVRPLEPRDVLDDDAQKVVAQHPKETLRLDIQCWCPEDETEARRRYEQTKGAIATAGGALVDSSFRYTAGLSLIRADIPASAVWQLAAVDRVRQISLLPRPLLTTPDIATADVDSLPPVLAPAADAPIVAVIDSGVRSAHPLLAPATLAALPAGEHIPGGEDEHGHGTLVASLALYGSLEPALQSKDPLRAAGKLLSIRVLDGHNNFPDTDLWVEHLESAIELAAAHGARVVNLSVGDGSHPYHPPAPDPIAAMVDELARQHDMVIVISAGNFSHADYANDPDIASAYPTWLLDHEWSGLLPPAPAALALTTGALVADATQGARPSQDSVDRSPIGKPGAPSPITRLGPGIEDMIKPELVAPGGTYGYDTGLGRFMRLPQGMVVGAAAQPPDRLLAADAGTSFAAPLVSHAALRVLGRYPALSANAVRALLLATAEPVETVVDGETLGAQREAQQRLTGYGRVSAERAEFSEDYRAVLLAENALLMDQVHFYSVPVPDSFFSSGLKMVALGLAFDPAVRATRLTYLSSHMSVYVYRGVTVEAVRAKYAVHPDDDKPPDELEDFRCKDLQPSDRSRLRGANQAARQLWRHGWPAQYRRLVVVVRHTNRWELDDHKQSYALALVLQTSERLDPPLYAQLRAELPLLAEIEPEIEL